MTQQQMQQQAVALAQLAKANASHSSQDIAAAAMAAAAGNANNNGHANDETAQRRAERVSRLREAKMRRTSSYGRNDREMSCDIQGSGSGTTHGNGSEQKNVK